MLKLIYSRAFSVLKKKPLKLWGISLLNVLLGALASMLTGGVPIVGLAVTLLLETSMTMIFLHGLRGEEIKSVNLFDCFKDWQTIKRVLCGMGWMYLWIFLWALIPFAGVVFAIIRGYEYRLVPYILVMEPEISPTEALQVSKERTNGYKGKMFLTDLLTYAVPIAAIITLVLMALIPYVGVWFFGLPAIAIYLAMLIFLPLILGLIQAAYYEEITNPTVPEVPEAPACNFCPNCGTPVTPGNLFCSNCGNKLQ